LQYVDPISALKEMPCGSMIYARAVFSGFSDFVTYFAIKEDQRFLRKLGACPVLTVRTGLFFYNGVALVPFMVNINGSDDMLYESWINYFASGDTGKKAFDDLTKQDDIIFIFYDAQCNEKRKISIKNRVRGQFQLFCDIISTLDPWSMEDFNAEREKLYIDYPTPRELWRALEETEFNRRGR